MIESSQRDVAWQGRAVLVTGGAGFIGSHLVETLISAGAKVRVLDDFSTGKRANLAPWLDSLDLIEGDLRNLEDCRRAAEACELIFHQAALGSVPRSMEDPATCLAVNLAGSGNLFTAARDAGVRRVIYASSSSVYGDDPRLPKVEGQEGAPLSPYALSKSMGEDLANTFARCFSLESVGLRYFNVYGPRQDPAGPYAAVVPRFLEACLVGRPAILHGDGGQSRDFTYVGDAVRANLLAADAPAAACGRAYNIGGGERTTVRELEALIRELCGGGPEPLEQPPRPGDVRHSLANLTAASAQLGYAPTVSLVEGLGRIAATVQGNETTPS